MVDAAMRADRSTPDDARGWSHMSTVSRHRIFRCMTDPSRLSPSHTVLSVDLAARRYIDNGIAVLRGTPGDVQAQLIPVASLGLTGTPDPIDMAVALVRLADAEGAGLIVIDGPQGWRAAESQRVHQRECEAAVRCPGKTGPPGIVLPRSWTRFAEFSIALFDALAERGWPRFAREWNGDRRVVESFPTHAWRSIGIAPLSGKGRARMVESWRESDLDRLFGVVMNEHPSHDEIQAVVAGIAGIDLLADGVRAVDVHGRDPFQEEGTWREGLIVSPTVSGGRGDVTLAARAAALERKLAAAFRERRLDDAFGLIMHRGARLSNEALDLEIVPSSPEWRDGAYQMTVVQHFALSFEGYDWGTARNVDIFALDAAAKASGWEHHGLGAYTLSELRAILFALQRLHHDDFGGEPNSTHVGTLLVAIRRRVAGRSFE